MFPLGETYRARSSPSKAQAPPAGAAPPGAGTTTHQAPHPAPGTPSSAETPLGTPRQHRHTRRPHHLPCHQPCTNNHSTGLVYMRILHWKLSWFCKLIFPQAHTRQLSPQLTTHRFCFYFIMTCEFCCNWIREIHLCSVRKYDRGESQMRSSEAAFPWARSAQAGRAAQRRQSPHSPPGESRNLSQGKALPRAHNQQ